MSDLGQRQLHDEGIAHADALLAQDDCDRLVNAVAGCRRSPGPYHRRLSATDGPGVESELFRWHDTPEIGDLVSGGTLVDLACRYFQTEAVVLLEDQWFWSEPGSATPSPWHQDEPYHPLDTPFLTVWIPLTPVPAGLGLRGVRGSHLGPIYAPVEFAAEDATLDGSVFSLDPVPDIDDRSTDVVDPPARPGDAVLLDSRTLHSAGGECPADFVRLSIRYAHPQTRFVDRPWSVAAFWNDHPTPSGGLVTGPAFPLVSR